MCVQFQSKHIGQHSIFDTYENNNNNDNKNAYIRILVASRNHIRFEIHTYTYIYNQRQLHHVELVQFQFLVRHRSA